MNKNISNNVQNNNYPPYKCKLCGLYEVTIIHDICRVCGWEDDEVQNDEHDFEGGANCLSYNQYKSVWESNKELMTNHKKSKHKLAKDLYYEQEMGKNE